MILKNLHFEWCKGQRMSQITERLASFDFSPRASSISTLPQRPRHLRQEEHDPILDIAV